MHIEHIKLYHYPATRSARVRWALHEVLDDAFEVERVDLYRGDQYAETYLAINPNHCVPALEITWEGGRVQRMIESAAMLAFIADAWPAKPLAPSAGATPERADCLQMLHFACTSMDAMLWQIRAHEHILPATERDARTAARYRRKFKEEVEPQLLARLRDRPYICGETFTVADCGMGHTVMWARGYGLCTDDQLRAYVSRLSKRPAFIRAFADAREFSATVPAGSEIERKFTG